MSETHRSDLSAATTTRAAFLARAASGVLGVAAVASGASLVAPAEEPSPRARWKGKSDTNVKRWDVITIGNLSRNRYWGEGDGKGVRSVICSCTLIQGDKFRLLVDPSLADAGQMARELDRRTGLKIAEVTDVFVTHEHGDHFTGLAHFAGARWLASPAVAEKLNRDGKLPARVEGVSGRLLDAADVLATPGHTPGHNSLRFDCDGLSVVVAGDAIATRDFFRERSPYYNAVDVEQSKRTMDAIADAADLIVPGHDNYFLSDR
jgi:glyoxylase-like metal-dependent hydrolase (beta-lactamase superfamily II)